MANKKPNKTSAKKPTALQWTAKRYAPIERPRAWYVISGVVISGLILQGLWTGNWLFVLLVCACTGLYIKDHLHNDEIWHISLTKENMTINDTELSWDNWQTAWFVAVPTRNELHLGGTLNRYQNLIVPLAKDIDPASVSAVLPETITVSEEKTEAKLDMIARLLKI